MKRFEIFKICLILSVIAVTTLWPGTAILAQDTSSAPKQVLAIFVYKQGMPWAHFIEESLRTTLATELSSPIEYNVEYADQSRFPEKEYLAKIVDLYRYKYGKQKMDLVFVLGDESTEWMFESGKMLFGDVPVVFVSTKQKEIPKSSLVANIISLQWGFAFEKSAALIQEVLPQTKNIFIISGISQTDLKLKSLAVDALAEWNGRSTIHYLDDYLLEDLLVKVAQLPEHSAILFLSMFRDGSGNHYVPRDIVSELSEKANVPIFGIVDLYLGQGILGGNVISADSQGKKFVEIARKILTEKPVTSADLMAAERLTMFDWRQLKRWSIDEERLPAGSIVRYRERTIWSEHKREVVTVTVIISILLFALAGLIVQYKRRNLAEEETQKLRDERAQMSRILAVGEIAASLAHELNQPLAAIRSYAQAAQRFLNQNPSNPDEATTALTGIVAGNRRAEEVIKRIRMALKKEPFRRSHYQVREVIEDVILLVRRKAKEEHVTLRLNFAANLPPLFCDRIQLQQVLLNLIINGIEAMTTVADPREIVVQCLREDSGGVRISVQDSGVGIDETQVDLLFDSFYTTKAEGMGIGLSISRTIIEDHGGRLWATRNPDRGSTFSFTLPPREDKI